MARLADADLPDCAVEARETCLQVFREADVMMTKRKQQTFMAGAVFAGFGAQGFATLETAREIIASADEVQGVNTPRDMMLKPTSLGDEINAE